MEKNRVLIADDSKLNQKLLSAILGDEYDYIYAENGLEVINLLDKNEKVDIILLDINMPQINGFDVLKVLNEQHYIEHIPVVIISVENDEEFVRKAYDLGATDYIPRPFNSVVVTNRVKNTLMLYSNQKRLVKLVENQIVEREKINNAMINIFSNIIEMRNHESGSHTIHVQSITNMLLHELIKISDKYKLNNEDISLISSLAALHDIGKISVPESVINKPGKLTDEEWVLMKKHTVEGFDILCHANIDQNSKFMKTAKAITRWHHEKFDGKGYPDGLAGDDIPISAQVVSMADVYDALTSERCYKKAFTHEQAISMILNGECGTFNPILTECLKNISDRLKESLKAGIEHYDYHNESIDLANEILLNNDLPVENTHFMLENEYLKRDFFEKVSTNCIKFEYDAILHKVRLINTYEKSDKRQQIFFSSENNIKLMSDEDWNLFRSKMQNTTRESPNISMKMLIPIDGEKRWHRLNAMSVWPKEGSSYVGVLGQFTDINDEIMNEGFSKAVSDSDLKNTFSSLKNIFSVVRLINSSDSHVLSVDENGNLVDTKSLSSDFWDKHEKEKNKEKSSSDKDESRNWNSRLEEKGGKEYSVLSKHVKINGSDCVLEVAFYIEKN